MNETFQSHPNVVFTLCGKNIFFHLYCSDEGVFIKQRVGRQYFKPIDPMLATSFSTESKPIHVMTLPSGNNYTDKRLACALERLKKGAPNLCPIPHHDQKGVYYSFRVDKSATPMHLLNLTLLSSGDRNRIMQQIESLIHQFASMGIYCHALNETCFLLDEEMNVRFWGIEHLYAFDGHSKAQVDHMLHQSHRLRAHLDSLPVEKQTIISLIVDHESRNVWRSKPIELKPTSFSKIPLFRLQGSDTTGPETEDTIQWTLQSIRHTHSVYTLPSSKRIHVKPISTNVDSLFDLAIPNHFRSHSKIVMENKMRPAYCTRIEEMGIVKVKGVNPLLLDDFTIAVDRSNLEWTGNMSSFIYTVFSGPPPVLRFHEPYIPLYQYLRTIEREDAKSWQCITDVLCFLDKYLQELNPQTAERVLYGKTIDTTDLRVLYDTTIDTTNLWISVVPYQPLMQSHTVSYDGKKYEMKASTAQFWVADCAPLEWISSRQDALLAMFAPFGVWHQQYNPRDVTFEHFLQAASDRSMIVRS